MTDMFSPTTPRQAVAMMPFMPNWQVVGLYEALTLERDQLRDRVDSLPAKTEGVTRLEALSELDDVTMAVLSVRAELRLRGLLQADDTPLTILTASRASGGRPAPAVRS